MKKWLAMLLSIVLTVQLAVPAWAADGGAEQPETVVSTVKSGMCGDNLTWTLNDDGVLAISGTGVIKDSAFDSTGEQPEIKTAIIGDGVTSIGNNAFFNCGGLTSVEIPDSVTSIGDGAFQGCSSLASVEIPNGITRICQNVFQGCSSLTSVTIPDSVTRIDFCAFNSCKSLSSITIPNSVTTIIQAAFSGCSSLKSITIPDGVATIDWFVFSNCSSLTSITIPDSVTTICSGAFSDCSGLTSVEIPDSVTSIGDGAFANCNALTDVYYGGSRAEWNKIGIGRNNDQLTGATIHYAKTDPTATPTQTPMPTPIATPFPDPTATPAEPSVPTSGTCGENLTWKIEDGVLTISGTGAMMDYSWCQDPAAPWAAAKIKSVVIESGVTSIGNSAFFYSSLTSITIPDSVTSIGDHAFDRGSLTSITIPDSVTSIGECAFEFCNLTSITIPDSVTSIGDNAFYGSSLTSIAIPDNVTNIGEGVFCDCTNLADDDGFVIVRNVLCGYFGKDADVAVPTGVTRIDKAAFAGCSSLASITIPDSITSIGREAFSGCSNLMSITIPSGVTSIGNHAFYNCSSLTSVEIPDSVASIGSNAFYNCTALKNVYYSSCSEAKWNSISIQSGNDDLKNAAMHYSDHRWDEGVITKPATRTEEGEKTFTCTICQTTRTETIPALTPEPGSVDLNDIAKDFDGSSIGMDADGKTIAPDGEGNYPTLTVPEGNTVLLSVSTYNLPEGADPHTRYPVGMAVYKLTNTDGTATVERISELDNLLRYAGSSIRITGNKGIRMITGVSSSLKNALTGGGAAGYTLEEYGTVLCRSSEINGGLSLTDGYARHNYAYSRANGADPVFRYAGDTLQYTNVLVGFSSEQCVDDIAMRPYITLRDADGNTYTLYGGIVNRSIGYIAYQNRGAFAPGTNAYNYIWDIIHFVYGDAYDEDYKG